MEWYHNNFIYYLLQCDVPPAAASRRVWVLCLNAVVMAVVAPLGMMCCSAFCRASVQRQSDRLPSPSQWACRFCSSLLLLPSWRRRDSSLFATWLNTALWKMAVWCMTSCLCCVWWLLNATFYCWEICSLSCLMNTLEHNIDSVVWSINNARCVLLVRKYACFGCTGTTLPQTYTFQTTPTTSVWSKIYVTYFYNIQNLVPQVSGKLDMMWWCWNFLNLLRVES